MRSLLFDTGPIISLTTNNLVWLIGELKSRFGGEFYITQSVKKELVEKPLATKKFKFEALQVEKLIEKGILKIYEDKRLKYVADQIFTVANDIFSIDGNPLTIVQYAESEAVAAAVILDSSATLIDERTTRYLIEKPDRLKEILKRKLHAPVKMNKSKLKEFSELVKGSRVLRSVELVTIAFEQGLLDDYIADIPDARRTLLESVLWGVKLHGCAISNKEIQQILKIETGKRKVS